MSKRKRSEVGSLGDDQTYYEHELTKGTLPHTEAGVFLPRHSFAKETSTFIMDDDAFVNNAIHCRKLQSELSQGINAIVSSEGGERSIQKQQQNILWSLVQYVSRDDTNVNEEIFASVTQLANDLILSSVTRYELKTKNRKEIDWIDGWIEEAEYTKGNSHLESANWSVHQLVYELLLQVLLSQSSRDSRVIVAYWRVDSLKKLLDLFGSPDSRERDYILSIIHVFYKSVVKFRRTIRKFICIRIQSIVFDEEESTQGITEMLEFCCSIIRGFAVPLKKEHEDFLMRCLLPLHKLVNMESFYPPLLFCIMAFLEKNPCLAPRVLDYLLGCWPISNSSKEVLFLNHLEEILAAIPADILKDIICKAVRRIGLCMASYHSLISHRAFLMLENGQVWCLLLLFRESTFPVLTHYAEQVASSHWNSNILQIASRWCHRLRTLN
ncbi:protein phosphatase 2 (formerly 2A), regulatory subunit B' [Galdieria sulphuraria]|uniref:Protein phosphatase 2 (Formerly 2A), regulatory subunit B n=1 Tax=Galdieria sulphuraria TaxID=130081 RepID=M2Y348_GALSU|nr:protein phosphatase 2 (formerly 2A), regulatory subunit B' [Galdieria sulphuraria]EME30353.1 protein phosphatase 2 (formerly 2A), regulatory subunit B' [Galdieria sulphuraria]|eukprot:XP_005706873.1 protein phosphatase 2 (formerly 2A), regulatory subunit B' [Galdieria sulphuraria]